MRKRILIATLVLAALSGASSLLAIDAQSEQKLQRGIDLLESRNDLAGAAPLFEQASHSSDRSVAARATLYLGAVQERQGKNAAQSTYQTILKQYGNLPEAAEARKRLVALGVNPSDRQSLFKMADMQIDEGNISPDGQFVAGIDWNTSDGDIAIQETTTGKITLLQARSDLPTASDEYGEWAALSPDQSKVLFFWDPAQKALDYQLRVMPNQPHSPARALFQLNDEIQWIDSGVWFPDSKSVLVQWTSKNDEWQFARIRTDGSAPPQILKSMQWRLQGVHGNPSISPDGKFIAYSALATNPTRPPNEARVNGVLPSNKDQYIYVLPTDGSGTETAVARSAGINEYPFWTPDGHILFLSDRPVAGKAGTLGLWEVEVTNGKPGVPSPVKPEIGGINPLGVNKLGSFYYSQGQGGVDIFSMDLKSGPSARSLPSRVTEFGANANSAPSWSPDGKRVAFLRSQPINASLQANPGIRITDVVVRNMDTGDEQIYSAGTNRISPMPPVWFHNGDAVLVSTNGALLRIDLKTHEFRSMESVMHFSLPAGLVAGVLSPDDKTLHVAVRENRQDPGNRMVGVVAVTLNTGEQKRIFSMRTSAGTINFALDPAGRNLAVVAQPDGGKTPRLYRISVDGGTPVDIGAATGDAGSLAWSPDGKKILFRSDDPARANPLAWIPASGGKIEYLSFNGNDSSIHSVAVNPVDPSRVLFSAEVGANELWRIDNLAASWGNKR